MTSSSPPASFYGWAFLNREGYCRPGNRSPAPRQVVADYRQKMAASGNLTNLLVSSPRTITRNAPKGCMGGWGSIFLQRHSGRHCVAVPQRAPAAGGVPVGAGAESGIDLGMTRSASTVIAGMTGCRSRAAPVMKKRKTWRLPLSGLYADRQRR